METHGMKFVVDTRDVAKGFRDYKAAVDGIFASLDKFEAHVAKTMNAASKAANNRGALNNFKKSMEAFGNVKIDPTAARRITALSQALGGFKAPSPAQAANLKKFFASLANVPDISGLARSMRALGNIKTSLAGFQAPSAAQSKRLVEFGKAMAAAAPSLNRLKSIAGISGIANELASISIAMSRLKAPSAGQVSNIGNLALALRQFNFSSLRGSGPFLSALGAISNFKAPSAAQIRNLQGFMNALGQLRVPANANELTAALNKIAAAAASANNSLRGLRGGLGGLGGSLGNVGAQARGASLQMMGLQNAFSGTFQIGSALRSLLGSLTIAELGRNFFKASDAALTFKAQMAVVNKEVAFGAEQLEWVNETSTRLGVDMLTAETGFAKVSIAASKAGMSVNETRHAFEGFSTAMTVLGTKTDRQNDVWLAVQQVLNKGYLSAEELNQQLNEHLPGAMAYAGEYAESLGMSLEKGLKNKALDADKVLAYMAKRMKEDFGPSLEAALNRPSTQMTILRNNVNTLFQKIGEAGASQAFTDLMKNINASMEPGDIERYAQAISDKLVPMINKLSDAFTWLRENWDSIKGPLGTTLSLLGKWMLISGTLQIGRFLVTPIFQLAGALRVGIPLMWDMVYASRALAATNLSAYLAQLAQIRNANIAGAVAGISNALGGLSNTATGRGLQTLIARITGIGQAARPAATAIGKLAGAIGTGLAVAWGAGAQAASESAEGQVKVQYSAGEIIYGMWLNVTDSISKLWSKVTDFFAGAWDATVMVVTGLGSWLAEKIGFNLSDIGSFAAKVAVGFAYVFQRAFEGIGAGVRALVNVVANNLSGIGSAVSSMLKGDFSGAGTKAMGVLNGSATMNGIKEAFAGYEVSGADFNKFYANTGRGFNAVSGWLNEQGARGRAGMAGPPKPKPKPKPKSLVDLDYKPPEKPGVATEDGGKGKKGKKGESPEAAANRIENLVDQLMGKFDEVDPLGGLYRDFVKTLTDQAHILLNDKGYANFIANLKTDSADGEVSVESLVKAMGEPGNLAGPVMADLKTRYKKDVGQIIDLLIATQAAYETAQKEATVKAMDFRDKSSMDLRSAFGDALPALSKYSDLLSKLTPIAQAILPNDAFSTWLGEFREGIEGGDMAATNLADAILDLAGKSPTLDQALKKNGLTAETAAEEVLKMGRAVEYAAKMAERSKTFGGETLFDMDQEMVRLQLTEREGEIFDKLTDAVKKFRSEGGELTAETIAGLEHEIRLRQDLADQLQRNKEFFDNNGIRSYINEVKDAGAAINELDKNVLQSLEDQLFSLGTTGKFSFGAIFDTIQQGIVRFSSQQIVKTLMENVFSAGDLNSGAPSLMGSLFGAIGIGKYGPSTTTPLGSNPTNAMWVQMVGPNGQITSGAFGINLNGEYTNSRGAQVGVGGDGSPSVYRPGGGIGGAANDNGVVGVEKTVNDVATQTATTFGSTFQSMMPMIGMAFASTFKSPIAQIGAMFLSMMLTKMMSAQGGAGGGGGLGGIFGKLFGGLFGGGGGGIQGASLDLIGSMPGIFKEGGFSNSPVGRASVNPAVFANAPHFAEGTHNTSGIPAILHDNEAVIPLSRGRKVPVEMSGGGGRGATVVNQNFNFTNANYDGFKRSKQQMAADMHMQANRAYARNN
jgi:tape measure domain-containing protein